MYAIVDVADLYAGPQLLEPHAFEGGEQVARRVLGMQQAEAVAQTAQEQACVLVVGDLFVVDAERLQRWLVSVLAT